MGDIRARATSMKGVPKSCITEGSPELVHLAFGAWHTGLAPGISPETQDGRAEAGMVPQ